MKRNGRITDQCTKSSGNFRRNLTKSILALTLIWIAIGAKATFAQAVYGSIFGTVTDNSGAVVPNATITVTDVSKNTSVTTKTDGSGGYLVQHLIADTYKVEAEASGFSKTAVDNVIVYVDTKPKVDIQLTVGAVSNTVTVTGGAPLLTADRAEVTTILNDRAVENLPNLNRNFTAFELLTPGTTYIGWGPGEGSGNPQRSQSIEVNGQLPFATGYELDGTDNQEPLNGVAVINPNLDAVSEMKVTSQNYDAEFGKAVAGLVTAQTKSGSNSFHGSAFEYRRSDAQQARDPFANQYPNSLTGEYLAPTLHNQFGGSVGGPVLKNKLFFFGDYQGLREKTGTAVLTTVPTQLALTSCTSGGDCNLSEYLQSGQGQIYKPNSLTDASNTNRVPYAGNIIPASDLSAPAIAFFKTLPAPNAGPAGAIINNFSASGSGIFNTNQADGRIDSTIGQKLHLFGRYTYFGAALSGAPYFGAAGGLGYGSGGFAGTDSATNQSVAAGGDYVVSASWLTDFRFGYYKIHNSTVGPDSDQPLGNDLGIPNANGTPLSLYGGLPQFNIDIPANGSNGSQNIEYGTSANPGEQNTSQYQFVNNWSHTVGTHNIKFGADYRYGKNFTVSIASNALRSGTYFFAQSRTSGSNDEVTSSGVGFATFLLGDTTTFWRTQTANLDAQTRQTRFFVYGQDQWRVTPKLTLNYGLRWELYTPESVTAKGAGGLLDLDTGILHIAGYGSNNNSLGVSNNYKMFAPRIGFAFQALPTTVIRGGFGTVYGQGWAGDSFGSVLTSSFPTQVQQSVNPVSNAAAVFNLEQGPPGYTFAPIPPDGNYPLPDGIYQIARPRSVILPTVQGWNLAIQQELTRSMTLAVTYVGSQAYHNMFESSPSYNTNQQTLAGFNQVNPNHVTSSGASCGTYPSGVLPPGAPGVPPECLYSIPERSPWYDGTAQAQLGVKFGAPYLWTQRIDYMANQATGSYQALQVVLNKRFASGLQFLTHYTWSHALGHESYEFLIDPQIGRGNGYYNRRQAFVFAGTYDLPFGKNQKYGSGVSGWQNQIIGGWQLNGNVTLQGGLPFTTNYAGCGADQDIGVCFLNSTGKGLHTSVGKYDPIANSVPYFTPSPYVLSSPNDPNPQTPNSFGPFSRPAVATWGNVGRDALWGPGLTNVDASLAKNFMLWEGVRFQMLVQAFNLFNHVNLNQPNSCFDCQGSGAGTISNTVSEQDGTSMRRLQFGARFQF
jgi:hypothetical protein